MGMNERELKAAIKTIDDGIENIEYFTQTEPISVEGCEAARALVSHYKDGDVMINVPEFLTFLDDLEYEFYKEKVKNFNMFKRYINEIKERLTGESK
jgi:esterase/lipase superfamily enzyme